MQLATDICDRASALDFLLGRINYERTSTIPYRSAEFKLDRMRRLLSLLHDPHLALRAVHIAGTKGKGSTASMIAAVLSAAGYSTGLYTSPHLERLEERFLVDGRQCDEKRFVALAVQVQAAVNELNRLAAAAGDASDIPTFFEITTAMAMLHFAQCNIDAAVLEVGLGGRLDSTNVCVPEVCLITSISYDHTRQLGSTLRAIAGEKAGIIKPGVPVVSGVVAEEPRGAIVAAAAEQGAPLIERGRDFDAVAVPRRCHAGPPIGQRFDYWENSPEGRWSLADLHLPLLGQHQAANAAAAIAALRQLVRRGWNISDGAIHRGLAAARCDARIEVIQRRPDVILDVAHNVASIEAIVEVLRARFPSGRRVLLFASSRDKDVPGMLRLLLPEFDHIVLTRYLINPRAVAVEELHSLARETLIEGCTRRREIAIEPDPVAAWRYARQLARPDDLICITGSFFLAAELLPHVR
jgi:dihydrofolate synthase/folylpolyglutamate synthase